MPTGMPCPADIKNAVEYNKLREIHDLSFKNSNVPSSLVTLCDLIAENRKNWKAIFISTWDGARYYAPKLQTQNSSNSNVLKSYIIRASKYNFVLFTENELSNIFKNYDETICKNQLIMIFVLLEEYLFLYSKVESVLGLSDLQFNVFLQSKNRSYYKLSFDNYFVFSNYLLFHFKLSEDMIFKLRYAKLVRNCFIHSGGTVMNIPGKTMTCFEELEKEWGDNNNKIPAEYTIYKNTNIILPENDSDKFIAFFHKLEDWTDILIEIVQNSLNKLEK
jgi:hypothetical protein